MPDCLTGSHATGCKLTGYSHHLLYEIEMLQFGWDQLEAFQSSQMNAVPGGANPAYFKNAVLESALIHTRSLLDALHYRRKRRKTQIVEGKKVATPSGYDTDLYANHDPRAKGEWLWNCKHLLSMSKRKFPRGDLTPLDRQLAHLTTDREPMRVAEFSALEWLHPILDRISRACECARTCEFRCGAPLRDVDQLRRWKVAEDWCAKWEARCQSISSTPSGSGASGQGGDIRGASASPRM